MTTSTTTAATAVPTAIKFDPEDLTLDEVAELEEMFDGVGIDSLLTGSGKKAPVLRAIVWMAMRRDNPDATLADAGRVRLRDIDIDLPGASDE